MNNFVKSGLVALCLGVVSSCAGKKEVKEPESVTIPLGSLKFVNHAGYVKYNGMTGDNQCFLLSGIGYSAVNTFYPVKNTSINFDDHRFYVSFVTPDSIGLTCLRE